MDLLLSIRGIAALSVVVWHAQGYQGEFPDLLNMPGRTAVWLFFGISGYVISYGFIHNRYNISLSDLKDFYINRFLRIYPLFISVSIFAWIVVTIVSGKSPIAISDIPEELFAIQFNHSYVLNSVFWTLGIEIQFYIIAPVLVLILLIPDRKTSLILSFITYLIMLYGYRYAVLNFGWSFDGRNIISNLPHFFIGMIGCRIVSTIKPSNFRFYTTLISACIILAYTNWVYHNTPGHYWSERGVFLIDMSILLFIVAHASIKQHQFNRNVVFKILSFFGVISYGVYALHSLLLKYYPMLSEQITLLLFITIIIAFVSYRIIEKPALKLKRKHNLNLS